jgi:hypothetical protein
MIGQPAFRYLHGLLLSSNNSLNTTAIFHEKRQAEALELDMQMQGRIESKRMRAMEALKAVLSNVSGVKLVDFESQQDEHEVVALIQVYGRKRKLACMIVPNDEPRQVHQSLIRLCDRAMHHAMNATPVLIAPRTSADLLTLCRETGVGLLDFEGNARIELEDLFIRCQQTTRHAGHHKPLREHVLKGTAHTGAAV